MTNFWKICLSTFKKELTETEFKIWLGKLRPEEDKTGVHILRLHAPNPFILKLVSERYLERIKSLYFDLYNEKLIVNIILNKNTSFKNEKKTQDTNKIENKAIDKLYRETKLIPTLNFDMLVSGKANQIAKASAQAVALNPGVIHKIFCIYGGTGLGKTHLMHAIGNEVYTHNSNAKICYIHASEYVSAYVKAIQNHSIDKFNSFYNSLDLLLIDDIQFFNGKEGTQGMFLNTYDSLYNNNKQIVITCDTYPKVNQGLEPRLVSRFTSNMVAQVEPPDIEMRVAILKKKSELSGISLNDDVAFMIAENIRSNVRELEGALIKVIAFAKYQNKKIDIDISREALKDIIGAHKKLITVEQIIDTVAEYNKLKVSELLSQRKSRAISRPRQIAMWLARELTTNSLPEIGEAFGGKDHTTVMHAIKKINDIMNNDKEFSTQVNKIKMIVTG